MTPRIAVLSYSSHTSINRKVWGLVSKKSDLILIIPNKLRFGKDWVLADSKSPSDPDTIPQELRGNNPRLYYFKGLWQNLRKFKPDVIFIENDPISFLCLYCCLFRLFFKAKIFCMTNENNSLSFKRFFLSESWKVKLILILKRVICFVVRPFVSVVFCINHEGKKVFEDLRFRHVELIPLGYDPTVFKKDLKTRELVREKQGLNSFTIGYFGRVVREKGLLILLQSLEGLRNKKWKLLIDDFSRYTDSYIKEIKTYIESNNLIDRVVFFHANHFEVANYMNACDLVVVPSFTTKDFKEQYGRVVQEAVACGCLTIVSDSGFLPNFFDNSFHVFKENDCESLQSKISEIFEMSEERLELLRAKSMQNIQDHFTIEAQMNVIMAEVSNHQL